VLTSGKAIKTFKISKNSYKSFFLPVYEFFLKLNKRPPPEASYGRHNRSPRELLIWGRGFTNN
jgi:hypothetical protein